MKSHLNSRLSFRSNIKYIRMTCCRSLLLSVGSDIELHVPEPQHEELALHYLRQVAQNSKFSTCNTSKFGFC